MKPIPKLKDLKALGFDLYCYYCDAPYVDGEQCKECGETQFHAVDKIGDGGVLTVGKIKGEKGMTFDRFKYECKKCGSVWYRDRPNSDFECFDCKGTEIDCKEKEVYKPTDKPKNKTQYSLLDAGFLKAMADNMAKGIKGDRKAEDWKEIDWKDPEVRRQYKDALLRHALEDENWASVACNAMLLWNGGE